VSVQEIDFNSKQMIFDVQSFHEDKELKEIHLLSLSEWSSIASWRSYLLGVTQEVQKIFTRFFNAIFR